MADGCASRDESVQLSEVSEICISYRSFWNLQNKNCKCWQRLISLQNLASENGERLAITSCMLSVLDIVWWWHYDDEKDTILNTGICCHKIAELNSTKLKCSKFSRSQTAKLKLFYSDGHYFHPLRNWCG